MSVVAAEIEKEVPAPFKIEQKITGWSVRTIQKDDGTTEITKEAVALERPPVVEGRTYKIKPAVTDSAMYITINDIVMDDGTHRPLEMFISSKHVAHQQWINALTRMISAIFRKPGPFLFVAEELGEIFDPAGGYFLDGKMMPSVVAHVGEILKEHFIHIGVMEAPVLSEVQQVVIAEKKEQAKANGIAGTLCVKCHETAVIMLDGCMTCTSCGESKCG